MTYREIRRADLKMGLDRETWALETEVSYVSRVVGSGEHTTMEIYFGRGFEGPPKVNWSSVVVEEWTEAPTVVISVLNWIQDEQDVYIGCILLVKACP